MKYRGFSQTIIDWHNKDSIGYCFSKLFKIFLLWLYCSHFLVKRKGKEKKSLLFPTILRAKNRSQIFTFRKILANSPRPNSLRTCPNVESFFKVNKYTTKIYSMLMIIEKKSSCDTLGAVNVSKINGNAAIFISFICVCRLSLNGSVIFTCIVKSAEIADMLETQAGKASRWERVTNFKASD